VKLETWLIRQGQRGKNFEIVTIHREEREDTYSNHRGGGEQREKRKKETAIRITL